MTQIAPTYALRMGAFNASARRIDGLKLWRALFRPPLLQGFLLRALLQPNEARFDLRLGTLGTTRTRRASGFGTSALATPRPCRVGNQG